MREVEKSDEQWRRELSSEQYAVLREAATERPFSGRYVDTTDPGVYRCAGCGAELFSSGGKFDHGCGWPSFSEVIAAGAVETRPDHSHGMIRTEALCAACGGHLGHLFDDGPRERGGMRYCINSVAVELEPAAPDAAA